MTADRVIAVGLMSGTSLDGMDAALVEISEHNNVNLLAFAERPYTPQERVKLETALESGGARELASLHSLVGGWAAEAVEAVLSKSGCAVEQLRFISFPGQTVWHQPPTATLQLGDSAILTERFGVSVVHDFRSRDLAAGGQGAPLVPLVDALCFSQQTGPRLLLNIGGMANVTWVPGKAKIDGVVAGDTGPGMAVIDLLARMMDPALSCDIDGNLARQGKVDHAVLSDLLADPFFATEPPRSTGREHFGNDYARLLYHRLPGVNSVATAVELTVRTVVEFCDRFMPSADELVVAGGGTHHPVVMETLERRLRERNIMLRDFGELYFDSKAKEAVAFAVLGWRTLNGLTGNIPAVTGAKGTRVLGSVSVP